MKRVERCSLEDTKHANKLVISEHLAHYRLILPRLKGRVLDAGSGEGFGVDMMRKAGLDAWGIDLSPEVVQKTNERYGSFFKPGSITQIPYGENEFDAITCMEVIEHVPEPDAVLALKEIRRVLRPGGVLVLSTPNVRNSIGAEVNDYHFKEYTSEEMTTMLRNAGFDDIEMLGLACSNKAVQGMTKSPLAKAWMKFKHMIGLNRPIGNLGYIMEKVLTGHTSRNILDEDCWSLAPGDETTLTMLLIGTKTGS
jgi:2-polyprenyl-3-methyl-5-hydroxy-6-metoxy-1,4-benzoquinol methylase